MTDGKYLFIRCKNEDAHLHNGMPRDGNIAAFVGKNDIFVRCPDWHCKYWVHLEFEFNGLNIDLRNAGITQSQVKPNTFKIDCKKASVVVNG